MLVGQGCGYINACYCSLEIEKIATYYTSNVIIDQLALTGDPNSTQERLTPAVVNSLDELETQFAKTHCLVTPAALDVVCQRTACKTPAVQNRPAERVFFLDRSKIKCSCRPTPCVASHNRVGDENIFFCCGRLLEFVVEGLLVRQLRGVMTGQAGPPKAPKLF